MGTRIWREYNLGRSRLTSSYAISHLGFEDFSRVIHINRELVIRIFFSRSIFSEEEALVNEWSMNGHERVTWSCTSFPKYHYEIAKFSKQIHDWAGWLILIYVNIILQHYQTLQSIVHLPQRNVAKGTSCLAPVAHIGSTPSCGEDSLYIWFVIIKWNWTSTRRGVKVKLS